eukprot:COSAG05_NODE_988_length_6284_cov_7.662571_4_plen_224_part_00
MRVGACRYKGGYVGTSLLRGLGCGLLVQLALELRSALGPLLEHRPLREAWVYKYGDSQDGRAQAVSPHGDDAAINLNLWLSDWQPPPPPPPSTTTSSLSSSRPPSSSSLSLSSGFDPSSSAPSSKHDPTVTSSIVAAASHHNGGGSSTGSTGVCRCGADQDQAPADPLSSIDGQGGDVPDRSCGGGGGLKVWLQEAPLDWDFTDFNRQPSKILRVRVQLIGRL